jgi:membrane-associated protease RseP (regulator of RpoE activity)
MKSIRAERFLAGLVSIAFMIVTGLCDGLPGPAACADDVGAPSRREAKPGRPRMEPMPPKAETPPRRPFDEADDGDEPRGGADNRPADRARPAASPRRFGTTFAPVPDAVREQLDLPEGVGLLLDSVEPGSPAAVAGLKRFDILTRFNDQIVCNADQVATLIKLRKPGPVPLTILRGGRERKIQVILPQADPADDEMPLAEAPGPAPGFAPGQAPGFPPGFAPGAGNLPGDLQKQMEDLARQLQKQPFGAGGGGGRSRTTRMSVSPQGNERIDTESDGATTIEIRQSAGKFTLEIRGADGAKVHAGKLDTEADRRRVPEAYRDRVEHLLEEIGGARR